MGCNNIVLLWYVTNASSFIGEKFHVNSKLNENFHACFRQRKLDFLRVASYKKPLKIMRLRLLFN